MECRLITAIVRTEALADVERRLEKIGVKGLSVSRVVGHGEYTDFFNPHKPVAHARVEIFLEQSRVDRVVEEITSAGFTGLPGDGLVVVLPVERVLRIRTRAECKPGEL